MSRWSSVWAIVAGLALTLAWAQSSVAGPVGGIGDGIAITRDAGGSMLTVIDPTRDATSLQFALFGDSTDTIVSGDWNGDGSTSLGIFRNASGAGLWILDFAGDGNLTYQLFGSSTDTPVPGDWDPNTPGDEIGVVRPDGSALLWIVQNPTLGGGIEYFLFGDSTTDEPVPGNWNADAIDGDEPGITRAAGAAKLWITTGSGGLDYALWGLDVDSATPGDYTGNGNSNYGVRQNGTNTFVLDASPIEYTTLGLWTDGVFNPGNIGQP